MADAFSTTRWTLLAAAARDDTAANDALAELCQVYWRPVYAYIRRHGHTPEDSADLAQGFSFTCSSIEPSGELTRRADAFAPISSPRHATFC